MGRAARAEVAEAGELEAAEALRVVRVVRAAALEMAGAVEAVDRVVDQVGVGQAPAGVVPEAVEGAAVEVEAVDAMRCRSSWRPVVGVAAAEEHVAVDPARPVAERQAAVEGLEAQLLLVEARRAAPAHRQANRCCKSLKRRCLRRAPSRL